MATAMTAVGIVYVGYWPHDSTEVQQGAARYLVTWLIVASALAIGCFGRVRRFDQLIDVMAGSLAAWMTISLIVLAGHANVRLGINELGWWIAIAALVSTVRRVTQPAATSMALLQLIAAVSLGVAVYGWHQQLIGFPRMIADYQGNPDAMLRQIGVDAESGSSMRIIFENRLYDGGPTGTFALANSMAAMLVGGLVVSIGLLVVCWDQLRLTRRVFWMAGIAIIAGMLLAARSRSAVLSLLLLIGWLMFQQWGRRQALLRSFGQRPRAIGAATLLLLCSGAGLVYVLRNTEWIQQAPASLAIRFNYWVACLKMVSLSPWFGVGPGQFKARYEAFRAEASSEQIADPHQFVLQTVTSGGLVSLILLAGLLGLLVWMWGQSGRRNAGAIAETPASTTPRDVVFGAMIGLAGVWVLGAALGQLPTIDAALIGTIAALGFALLMGYRENPVAVVGAAPRRVRSIAGYAAAAMWIDLSASGGMTVPGVSVVVWTLVGIAVPVEKLGGDVQPVDKRSCWWRRCGVIVPFATLITWYWAGVAPIERVNLLANRFEAAWTRGQVEQAVDSLEKAVHADRWDVQPLLQLTAAYRSIAIARPATRPLWEAKWLSAERAAIARAGLDPVVIRQLGDNRLRYFQHYGDAAMLAAADRLFSQAVKLAPAHETYAAQWAAILHARGDERAAEVAANANRLAQAGGYYERSLDFTMVFPAQHFGDEMVKGAVQRPAAEVLAPLLEQRE